MTCYSDEFLPGFDARKQYDMLWGPCKSLMESRKAVDLQIAADCRNFIDTLPRAGIKLSATRRVKQNAEPLTIGNIAAAHASRRGEILARLREFEDIWKKGADEDIWAEMVFCFFTGGCSARMGIRSLAAVRPLIMTGTRAELASALAGSHRYPNARARYVFETRSFLIRHCGFKLREMLENFPDAASRRDWLAKEKGIKGLAYKEASHFLRNIGFKGYGILDKHVLRCMAEIGILENATPPKNRASYIQTEERLKRFADAVGIDFDELDLVLWSMKTGEILK